MKRINRKRYAGFRAFTLVEMLLVLLILSILAAIAAPRYANFLAIEHLSAAATRVASDLAYARRRARTSSTAQSFIVDVAANSYRLPNVPDLDHPADTYRVVLADEPYGATIVSVNLGGDQQVIFDGYGLPDSSGSIVISVGSNQMTVNVPGIVPDVPKGPMVK